MRWEFASCLRPLASEEVSGDAVFAVENDDVLLCGVIDGLGHGREAHAASSAFVYYVTRHREGPLDQMILSASRHIAGTRGAAASVMRFNMVNRTFEYCGVGNCHLHVVSSKRLHPISYPGIVGHRIRKVSDFVDTLPDDGGLFILCSDGISTRVHPDEYSETGVQEIVDGLVAHLGKDHDDATALAVRISAE